LASEWQFIEADAFKKRLAANEHMLVACELSIQTFGSRGLT
jgi:hypothetical protein